MNNTLERPIRRPRPKLAPTVVVDSREQCPLVFENLPTERGTLDTADYSVKGLESVIAVERKSLEDLVACVGRERDRFKRELHRLRGYRFRLLVIESTAEALEAGGWQSAVTPAAALGSLAAWTAQYSLPIWLAGNHSTAARFVERFLFQAARTIATEHEAAMRFVEAVASE